MAVNVVKVPCLGNNSSWVGSLELSGETRSRTPDHFIKRYTCNPLLRAKLIHVAAEPGGSRGTVVIVRTRVGFGVSLVGGGARVQVFERSICAPNGHFWRLLRYP